MFNQDQLFGQKMVSYSTSVNVANLLLLIMETSDGHQGVLVGFMSNH